MTDAEGAANVVGDETAVDQLTIECERKAESDGVGGVNEANGE